MSESWDSQLEKILREVEFPGEDEKEILAYLREHPLCDGIMDKITRLGARSPRQTAWAVFCLLNLVLLALLGTSNYIVRDFFAIQATLSQVFFLFLGLSFLGGLVGLVLCLDTSRFDQLFRREV